MNQRINITLPVETIDLLDRVTDKGGRSRFIAAAVKRYAEEAFEADLKRRLKEGALRRAARDRQLAEDWFGLEEEICPPSRNP